MITSELYYRNFISTCLIPEIPELEDEVFSLARDEGQTPLVILFDPKFEEICNPDKSLMENEVILQK